MPDRTSHEADFFAWSEQQAEVLRRVKRSAAKLPNELDLETIAEEIEDLGRTELNAVQSFLRQIFVHLMKIASAPGHEAAPHWRKEVVAFHNDLLARFTPAMAARIDLDLLWARAQREAEAALAAYGRGCLRSSRRTALSPSRS
jgi:hypothetical protein